MLHALTRSRKRTIAAVVALLLVAITTTACGTSGDDAGSSASLFGEPEGPQIIDNGRILTLDDLAAVGFKEGQGVRCRRPAICNGGLLWLLGT